MPDFLLISVRNTEGFQKNTEIESFGCNSYISMGNVNFPRNY